MRNFSSKNIPHKNPLQKRVRTLATQYFLYWLQAQNGGITFRKLHIKIFDNVGDPNAFYKNLRGVELKNKSAIDQIEQHQPGSRRILFHPLWDILAAPDASLDDVHQIMCRLHPDLVNRLFKTHPDTAVRTRKAFNLRNEVHKVAIRCDLDALAALLLLCREMELHNRLEPYVELKWAIVRVMSLMTLYAPFNAVLPGILEIVSPLFLDKNNPLKTSNLVMEMWPGLFVQPQPNIQLNFDLEVNAQLATKMISLEATSESNIINFMYIAMVKKSRRAILDILYDIEDDNKPASEHPFIRSVIRLASDKRRAISTGTFFD